MMLQLARALPKNEEKFFGGWILAGIEVEIKGDAMRYTAKTVLNKSNRAILEVQGTSAFGTELKKLRSFLVLPKEEKVAISNDEEAPLGKMLFAHYFTEQEVEAYVAYTGDENIIHKGENAIVPGLCMTCWLQEKLELHQLHWRASFLRKVYVNELVSFYLADNQIMAYENKKLVFTIKIL